LAVNGFLDKHTRPWAEARCRVACGLTLLTPGVPMFDNGYRIASASLTAGAWIEALNSDDESYGGRGIRNRGVLASASSSIDARLPASGIVVFQRL
jgi:hypothetical protein